MAAGGCRDCTQCTETGIKSLIMAIPRLVIFVCGGFLMGMFQKKCPQCGHKMNLHQKRADGSFQDQFMYNANPSIWRGRPIAFSFAVVLIPTGVGILFVMYWLIMSKADEVTIDTDRIIWRHGLLSKRVTEVAKSKVARININQTFFQRIFGACDMIVITSGDQAEIVVNGLGDPEQLRSALGGFGNQQAILLDFRQYPVRSVVGSPISGRSTHGRIAE